MDPSAVNASIPSEYNDEADDALLPFGQIWAYPCKLASCPDYGNSWTLRSNFLLHLYQQEAHTESAATPAARREIEVNWRYATDPNLPPRRAPDFRSQTDPGEAIWYYSLKDLAGKIVDKRGTERQMNNDLAKHDRAWRAFKERARRE